MILRSIEMESFGKFHGQTIEFRRGMNLVIGPNETGKSTIAEAVPAVLFGTDRLERYKPWGRNACSASLFFEGGGRTIQVKRNLVTDEVELVERDDLYQPLSQFSGKAPLRGRSSSCREYRELLESLLGVADEKLFRATYFFGHQPQEWTGDELAQKLRTLVSGTAEVDYADILDSLLDEHFSLTRSNPWGRDKQRDREYEDVCREIENHGPAGTVPVFVEIDDSIENNGQIEALSAELINDRLEYEKGLRYVEHLRSRLTTIAEIKPLTVVEAPLAAGPEGPDDICKQLVAAGLPEDPPSNLVELLAEAAEIRQEMSSLQQPYAALGKREKQIPTVPWTALLSVSVLLALVTGAAWWRQLYPLPVSVFSGTIVGLFSGWCGWRFRLNRNARAECKTERGRLDQKKSAIQQRQAELTERCEALGLPSSPIDLVRLQKLVSSNRELLESYWARPVAEQPVDDVERPAEPRPPEQIEAAGSVEEDGPAGELQEIEARLAEFAAEINRKEGRLQELSRHLENSASSQAAGTGGNHTALQKRKHELESRITLLRKAINLLAGAVDEFSRSHLLRLNHEAGKLFAKITAGRYAEIRLDENMAPSVLVDKRRWMPAESFSKGTVDALYLALRTALTKIRDDGRTLPLMLDDPFVHLDQRRLATALNMVDLASADGQLVLFSHNLELGKRAARERWHVVPLDGGGVDDTRTSEEGGEHAGQLHLL